jgi:Conjugal transfer protein TraD
MNLHWALRMTRRQLSEARSDARREDTREKIELGGLVVKAGLRDIDRAVILGILLDGAGWLGDPQEQERLRRIGAKSLGGKT